MDVHARATGIEPISSRRYAANNPSSQLWIHITGWHSVPSATRCTAPAALRRGRAPLLAESRIAAELQTCDLADVPRDRDEVRAYYERVRPGFMREERALRGMHYLLRPDGDRASLQLKAAARLIGPAAVATLPAWMRELGGFDQSALLDVAWKVPTRLAVRASQQAMDVREGDRAVLAADLPKSCRPPPCR